MSQIKESLPADPHSHSIHAQHTHTHTHTLTHTLALSENTLGDHNPSRPEAPVIGNDTFGYFHSCHSAPAEGAAGSGAVEARVWPGSGAAERLDQDQNLYRRLMLSGNCGLTRPHILRARERTEKFLF